MFAPPRKRKQAETPMTTQDSPSLYDRLGGVYGIATVIDDFIDRIMVDPRLNANPRVSHVLTTPNDGQPILGTIQ